MLPYQLIAGGSFTSDSAVARQEIQVSDQPDLIWVRNRTAWGDDAAETSVESWWRRGMAQDAAQTADQAVTTGILSSEAVTSGGFRVYNTFNPPTYASLALSGTEITTADPAVATMADTGAIQPYDVVRLDNTTAMLQVSGIDFSVTAVSTNTNITLNLDSQNFAAAATAGNARLIIPGRHYPRRRYIYPVGSVAGITQATSAVVCTSVYHDFSVGEKVRLKVPSAYGMTEAHDQVATVTAIGNASGGAFSSAAASFYNAVQLDLDSSAFTAFAIPTSATYAAGVTPAEIIPVGAGPYPNGNPPYVSTDAAFDNRDQWVIVMGSNIVTSTSAVYDWCAWKYDNFSAL